MRKIRGMLKKYGESTSNITARDFVSWIKVQEQLADKRTDRLYGL